MWFSNSHTTIDAVLYDQQMDVVLNNEQINTENPEDFLISSFQLSSETISSVIWNESINDEKVCDIGFKESIRPQTNAFVVEPISGNNFCYSLSGSTFNGGFYQGYYKLDGYEYQVLPNRYLDGVTFEMEIEKRNFTNTCADKIRLNDFFEGNEGFIFYYGLKTESPYCGKEVSGKTCEDVPLNQEYEDITIYPWEEQNPFLYYTDQNLCETVIDYMYSYDECCESVECNALGVRITDEGKINLRFLDNSGTCIDNVVQKNLVLKDYTTDKIHIDEDQKYHIILKFDNISHDDECDLHQPPGYMELSIFVNGMLVMCERVPELYQYRLNLHRSLQVGIPYNISIGGGTLGNLENNYSDIDYSENGCTYSFCFSEDFGTFNGYVKNGQTILFDTPVDKNQMESKLNDVFLSEVQISLQGKSDCKTYVGYIDHSEELDSLLFENFQVKLKKEKCYQIKSQENCNILSNYFAGSFIGEIDYFKIYDKALSIQAIRKLSSEYYKMKCC